MRRWMGITLGVCLAAATAAADTVGSIKFDVKKNTSFWGPNASASSLDVEKRTPGAVGVGFTVEASTGDIGGHYKGNLSLLHPDTFFVSSTPLGIGTGFGGGSGSLQTGFGAAMDVFGFAKFDVGFLPPFPLKVDLEVSVPPFPLGNFLATSGSLPSSLGTQKSFSGKTNFDIPAFDASFLGVEVVTFGPTFVVTQASKFTPNSIKGVLEYTHRATGDTFSTPFTVGETPDVVLDRVGWYDFRVKSLVLHNTYSTGFTGAVGGFIDTIITPRAQITTPAFNLLSVSGFKLPFHNINGPQFSIQAVPEPGSLALLGLVGAGFVALRRRRARRSGASETAV